MNKLIIFVFIILVSFQRLDQNNLDPNLFGTDQSNLIEKTKALSNKIGECNIKKVCTTSFITTIIVCFYFKIKLLSKEFGCLFLILTSVIYLSESFYTYHTSRHLMYYIHNNLKLLQSRKKINKFKPYKLTHPYINKFYSIDQGF